VLLARQVYKVSKVQPAPLVLKVTKALKVSKETSVPLVRKVMLAPQALPVFKVLSAIQAQPAQQVLLVQTAIAI
jgi:hypothetical protein